MNVVVRLLIGLLASLIGWIGFTGSAVAGSALTAPPATYAYDHPGNTAALSFSTTERGKPATHDHATTYDAVARGSHDAPARPEVATPPATYDYDHYAPLAQCAVVVHSAQERDRGTQAGRSSLPSSGVAAETGWTAPTRLARVTEAKFAGSPSLGPPGAGRVFVTAAEDIEGISTSQGLAERLTLLDDAGKLREGPFAVTTFDTPAEGLGVPVFRTNPGFVQGGFTQGGAREFDLDNLLYKELGNVEQRIVP